MPFIKVDFNGIKPKFKRPDLLQHPSIPKYLAGVNPRRIMGREWWDAHRRVVYERNNYHCFACGISAAEAPIHQWLEAHECYDYMWEEKILRYRETVALCYRCHNFIHSGRLYNVYLDGKVTREELLSVLLHGFKVLHKARLVPSQKAVEVAKVARGAPADYLIYHGIQASDDSVWHAVGLLNMGWVLAFRDKRYNFLGKEIVDE